MTVLAGRYRLSERIATGGMGEVWAADDVALGRPVAVKILKAEYAGSPEFRVRFRQEARHAAALSHPGVAHVYDSGEGDADHPPYLVMELVDGEPLSALLAREGPLAPERTADLVAQAAGALDVAHRSGVVHRDVKPGNLLICRDGTVKITDFGVARAVDAAPLTQADAVVGTPLYLSPEQAAGRPATAASDLYALGIVAYECLTGRPPFEGDPTAVTLAHRDEPLPRSIPGPIGELVGALTAKDPARRPPRAADVADWARRLAGGEGAVTRVGMPVLPPTGDREFDAFQPGQVGWHDPAAHGTYGAGPYHAERTGRRALLIAAGGVSIAMMAGGFGYLLRGSDGTPSSPPAADGASARPRVQTVLVEEEQYEGRPVGLVARQLRALGLRPEIQRERAPGRPGTVLRVSPTGQVPEGAPVTVVASLPERDDKRGRGEKDKDKDEDRRGRGGNSGRGGGNGGGDGGGD
jgi:hypothetical protein